MDGSDAVWCALMCGSDYGGIMRILLGIFLLVGITEHAAAQRHRDPCRLLSDAEMRAVQGHATAQKVPTRGVRLSSLGT